MLHTQCGPSRCAMITGRYMHVLGHRTQTHLIQDYEPNFFRYLKEAGYHVTWHGKNDMLSQAAFPLSVTNWTHDGGISMAKGPFVYGEPGYFSFLAGKSDKYGNDSEANGDYRAILRGLEFMRNDPPEPFVVFLPGKGSHPNYGAPADYYDRSGYAHTTMPGLSLTKQLSILSISHFRSERSQIALLHE